MALQKLLEVEMSYVTTDKGILYFEGDEPKVDLQVWLKDENENNLSPESGVYLTETQKITIEGGRIASFEEIEKTEKEKFEAHKIELEATYQEVERNLINLMWDLGYDCYLIENNSEYALFNVWTENGEVYLKLDITVDENGEITSLSNPTEMELKYVEKFEEVVQPEPAVEVVEEPTIEVVEEPVQEPVQEPTPQVEPVVEEPEPEPATDEPDKDKLLAEALETIEALRKQVADLEKQPAANSPSQEFENIKKLERTGDEKIDGLLKNRGFMFK